MPLICRLLPPKFGLTDPGQFDERLFGLAKVTPDGSVVKLPMTPSNALLGLVTVTITVVFPPGEIFAELSVELTEAPVNAKAGVEPSSKPTTSRKPAAKRNINFDMSRFPNPRTESLITHKQIGNKLIRKDSKTGKAKSKQILNFFWELDFYATKPVDTQP